MSENPTRISRRRVIAGAGGGALAIWAAPAITTLSSAGAAGSRCSVYKFFSPSLSSPSIPPFTFGIGQTFVAGSQLQVSAGDVDVIGTGTPWDGGNGYINERSIDLNGSSGQTLTILSDSALGGTPKAYTVELDVYGSVGSDSNTVDVKIGGVSAIPPTAVPGGIGTLHTLTGSVTAGGVLTLTQTSAADNEGVFLRRLEVFLAQC
jgi:hypothetical protein